MDDEIVQTIFEHARELLERTAPFVLNILPSP